VTSPIAQRTTRAIRLTSSPWVFDPLLGFALGLAILGIGGRIAMRVIAHATNVAPAFSLGGTITVVFLGAVSGIAGGFIYAVLARLLPRGTVFRGVAFGIILALLTLRGASPSTPLTLSLFLPLTFLYGGLLDYVHRRRFT
jgi:putative exporter of polyketide antibiotics